MSKFMDAINHAVFVDNNADKPTEAPAAIPASSPNFYPSASAKIVVYPPADPAATNTIYDHLVSKTDPNSSPVIKGINALAVPLESIITDRALRLRAVMAQSGTSSSAVASAIDDLLTILDRETQSFAAGKKAHLAEADSMRSQADAVQTQINELQNKHANLFDQIKSIEADANSKDAAFASAKDRRKNELLAMKSEYLNLK